MTEYSGYEFGVEDIGDPPMDQRRRAAILAASTLDIVVGRLTMVPQFAPHAHPEMAKAQRLATDLFDHRTFWEGLKKGRGIPTSEFPDASVLLPLMIATAVELGIEEANGTYKVFANSYGENVVFRPWKSEMEKVHQLRADHPGWYFLKART